ncbi:MAG TPA: hypothetical protein VEV20_08770 [Burkholderiales bacterium]|nr:hypothetical protein [Burkholderiales bacterium]
MGLVSRMIGHFVGERLRVELRPASVTVSRYAAFPRPRVTSTRSIEVTAAAAGSSEHPPEPWRASLDTLASVLREQRGSVGRVEVVLSDHFVRYALIPWSENLVADSERLGFARLGFRNVYGPLSDGWDVCVDEQPAGQASFASAVDRPLIAGLRDVMSLAGGRLDTVRPALADCLNRHSRVLKEPEFCLAMSEPGRISLAFRSRAGWQAVRSRRIEGSVDEILPTLLKQESAAGSAPESGVLYLCAADIVDLPHFTVPGWKLVRLAQAAGSIAQAQSGVQPRRAATAPLVEES